MFKPFLISLLTAPLLWAVPTMTHKTAIPAVDPIPASNLQNYLNYQMDYELHMTCRAEKIHFVCQVPKYKHESIDEQTKEVTETVGMRQAKIYFGKQRLTPLLGEQEMKALYLDMAQVEAANAKSKRADTPMFYEQETSPLQEELDKTLAEALRSWHISDFYLQEQNSSNNVTVKEIELLNSMQRSAGNHHYDYPVFGDISLKFNVIQTNKKQYHTFTEQLIESIEETFDTPDLDRKKYVLNALNKISAIEFDLPSDMTILLQNRPAKQDEITIKVMMDMHNSAGTRFKFAINALVTGASEFLLKKAQNKPVSADLILQHILFLSTWGSADTYAKMLKSDLKFRTYIQQYAAKIDALLSEEINQSSDKAVASIVQKFNTSFHHLLDGSSDTLKIELNSRNNTSVTTLVGSYMQAVMLASMGDPKDNNASTGVTSILNKEYIIYVEDSQSKR